MKETEKKKFWGVLRDEWNKWSRYQYSDEQNLAWLSGRMGLLYRLGMNEIVALKQLMQEKGEQGEVL